MNTDKKLLLALIIAVVLGLAIPLGTFVIGLIFFVVGILLCVTIIGLILGLMCFAIGAVIWYFAIHYFFALFFAGLIGGFIFPFIPGSIDMLSQANKPA